MRTWKPKNDLPHCLKLAKRTLERRDEHMGVGEMFILIMIAKEQISRFSQDKELVKDNRHIYDAVHYSIDEYLRRYGTGRVSKRLREY